MPCIENVADVANTAAFANVTEPGPLTLVHCVVREGPGTPSSVAVPDRAATLIGNVMVWSGPASTVGGALATPPTVTVTSSLADSSPSLAVNVSTYVPVAEKSTLVLPAAALPKNTVPGPLILVHSVVTGAPLMPSSMAEPMSVPGVGNVTI